MYWNIESRESWGFTLCSFAVMIVFVFLLILSHFVLDDAWRPDSENGVLRGAAPILRQRKERQPKYERLVKEILGAL